MPPNGILQSSINFVEHEHILKFALSLLTKKQDIIESNVHSLRCSQLSTAFICLSVEFQHVVTQAGTPHCPNSISKFSLKEVLVWSKEFILEVLARAALINLVFLRPAPIPNWRVGEKHWSLVWDLVLNLLLIKYEVIPNIRIIKVLFSISLSWKTCAECFFPVCRVITDVFNLSSDLELFTYCICWNSSQILSPVWEPLKWLHSSNCDFNCRLRSSVLSQCAVTPRKASHPTIWPYIYCYWCINCLCEISF